MVITLVAIDGYWWLFYWWILVLISGYYISGYWWLLMAILLVDIDVY